MHAEVNKLIDMILNNKEHNVSKHLHMQIIDLLLSSENNNSKALQILKSLYENRDK